MFDFLRARVWANTRSVPRMLRLLAGRASPRRSCLFAAAVDRLASAALPDGPFRDDMRAALEWVAGYAEGVADGVRPGTWDDVFDATEVVRADLGRAAEGAPSLRPAELTALRVLDVLAGKFPTADVVSTVPAGPAAALLRDIFGNPFRPVGVSPEWRTATAITLAGRMYESRDFDSMPILADALQDAGCDDADILDHCRGPGPHVRGCWVVDLVLGKE